MNYNSNIRIKIHDKESLMALKYKEYSGCVMAVLVPIEPGAA